MTKRKIKHYSWNGLIFRVLLGVGGLRELGVNRGHITFQFLFLTVSPLSLIPLLTLTIS
ncbi:MAG: hypothetical protein ACI837_003108 [Crocinitomicaceae bacterium]|jgi:hypothetical protein